MWMASDQLLHYGAHAVIECEPPFFARHLRMKNHLQQQIAELLAKICVIAGVDRRSDFVGFFDDTLAERSVVLLPVPRASIGSPETGHNAEQLLQWRKSRVERVGGSFWKWLHAPFTCALAVIS
jgi:hypothetical protein